MMHSLGSTSQGDKHEKASAHKVTGAAGVSKSRSKLHVWQVSLCSEYIGFGEAEEHLLVWLSIDSMSHWTAGLWVNHVPGAKCVQAKPCRGCQLWAPVSGPRPWGLKAPSAPPGRAIQACRGSKALFFYLDGDLVGSFLSISW